MKDYHRDDIAVQTYIAMTSGVSLESVSLAHVNNSFVYQGDGRYEGLLNEVDLTEEALSRRDEVEEWVRQAHEVVALEQEPVVETGPQCSSPFSCGFCGYCNRDKVWPDYPLSSLPRLHHTKRKQPEDDGIEDVREVPENLLNLVQLRVKECSIPGQAFFDAEGAAADLACYGFPAYFLDFETVMLAVPIWKGCHPYVSVIKLGT